MRSGLCAGQSSSSTSNSLIHVFADLALCTGAQSSWNRKGPSPNCSHKVGSMELSNFGMPKHSEFLSLELSGQAQLLKTPSLGTVQSDKYHSPGNRQTQTRPSDCQMEKCDSSLQRTRLHCSIVQWRRALHLTLCIALADVWLGCSCSAMETHSMKLFWH